MRKFFRVFISLALIVSVILSLFSSLVSFAAPNIATDTLTGIDLSANETVLDKNASRQLKVYAVYDTYRVDISGDTNIGYTNSNPYSFGIDKNGNVTADNYGVTTITVSYKTYKKQMQLFCMSNYNADITPAGINNNSYTSWGTTVNDPQGTVYAYDDEDGEYKEITEKIFSSTSGSQMTGIFSGGKNFVTLWLYNDACSNEHGYFRFASQADRNAAPYINFQHSTNSARDRKYYLNLNGSGTVAITAAARPKGWEQLTFMQSESQSEPGKKVVDVYLNGEYIYTTAAFSGSLDRIHFWGSAPIKSICSGQYVEAPATVYPVGVVNGAENADITTQLQYEFSEAPTVSGNLEDLIEVFDYKGDNVGFSAGIEDKVLTITFDEALSAGKQYTVVLDVSGFTTSESGSFEGVGAITFKTKQTVASAEGTSLDLSETKTNYNVAGTSSIKIYSVESGERTDITDTGSFEYELDSDAFSITDDGTIKAEANGVSLLTVKYGDLKSSIALSCLNSSESLSYTQGTSNPFAGGVDVSKDDTANRDLTPMSTANFISFWFYDNGGTDNQSYFSAYDTYDGYAILKTDNDGYYKYNVGGAVSTSTLQRTTGWHQGIITVDSSHNWKMFIDGTKIFENGFSSAVEKIRLFKGLYYYNITCGAFTPTSGELTLLSDPYAGAVKIDIADTLEYEFDDDIEITSATNDHVYILDGSTPVPAEIVVNGNKVTITPDVSLAYDKTYKIVFTRDFKGKERISGQKLLNSQLEKNVTTRLAPLEVKTEEDLSDIDKYKFKITYKNNEEGSKKISNVLVTYKNGVVQKTVVQTKDITGEDYIEIEALKADSTAAVLYYFRDFATETTSTVKAPIWKAGTNQVVSPMISSTLSEPLNVNVDTENDKVNIKGYSGVAVAGVPVFVYTMAEGKTLSNIANGDMSNILSKFAVVYTNANGVYSLDEKMSATSKNYDIYVYANNAKLGEKKGVEAITKAERDAAVSSISTADATNIAERFASAKYFLQLDASKFDNFVAKEFVYGCLIAGQTYADKAAVELVYNDVVGFIDSLEQSGSAARAYIIANKATRFSGIRDDVYTHLTTELTDGQVEKAVAEMLKLSDFTKLNQDINKAVVYSSLMSSYGYQELKAVAEKFDDIIGIEAEAASISSKVYEYVVEEKNTAGVYKNVDDFKTKILGYHTNGVPSTNPPLGDGSGSSGGSSLIVSDDREVTVDEGIIDAAQPKPQPGQNNEVTSFSDLTGCEWAEEAIHELLKRNVVNGVGNSEFAPNNNVTREEFVKMVVLAFNISSDGETQTFNDVDKAMWYCDYVNKATAAGVITGVGENRFGIRENVTREDAAVMMKRALDSKAVFFDDIITIKPFFDTDSISDYAQESVALLRENLIINGVGGNYYMPKNTLTRAEAAKMIYEAILYYEEVQ